MAFTLPPLPYALDALEPHMGRETLELHHGKHHQAYITALNNLIQGTELENKSLEEIVKATYGNAEKQPVFNNAGQAWNHDLFWKTMKPGGGGKPTGKIGEMIERDLGGYESFVEEFKKTAVGQFGAGWGWLALDGDKLALVKTPNGENPLVKAMKPLLGVDVWEHAYYLDYRNRRPDYVAAFLNHLVNWDEVEKQLS